MSDWVRYRLKTRALDDCRPIIFNPSYPWWCSGYAGDNSYAIVIAYLPKTEALLTYWNDAYEVDEQECDGPTFSDRFPKPDYYVELEP